MKFKTSTSKTVMRSEVQTFRDFFKEVRTKSSSYSRLLTCTTNLPWYKNLNIPLKHSKCFWDSLHRILLVTPNMSSKMSCLPFSAKDFLNILTLIQKKTKNQGWEILRGVEHQRTFLKTTFYINYLYCIHQIHVL